MDIYRCPVNVTGGKGMNVGTVKLEKVVVVVVTRPLPRDGGMAGDHGAPKAGQLSRVCTRDRRETESRQKASGANNPLLDSAE